MKRIITPWVRSLAAGLLLAGAADLRAQMSCRASVAEPRNLRTEGVAELLADVILECEGGTPVPDGQDLPRFQIIAAGSTPLSSRVLVDEEDSLFQWTEALLVIDDIAPQRQIPCASLPVAPSSEPPEEDTGCHLTTGPANVFQGQRMQENAVVFQNVAINPPGPGIVRKLRIVNLRADVREFTDPVTTEPDPLDPPVDPSVPPEVFVAVQMFAPGGDRVSIENSESKVGQVLPIGAFSLRTADDGPVSAAEPAILTTPEGIHQGQPALGPMFMVKFSEGFADAYRRRNTGTSGSNPAFLVSQASPGIFPSTESGFFNGTFPSARGLNRAGLADSGTRLMVILEGIPEGLHVWFSFRDVARGTTNYDAKVPKARLTHTDISGKGPFTGALPESGDYVEIWPVNGIAAGVWEIVSSDPTVIEDFTFTIGLTAPFGPPSLGKATIYGSIAPVGRIEEDTESTELIFGNPTAVPGFRVEIEEEDKLPAFSLVPTIAVPDFVSVSAASYDGSVVAPESIVAGFGSDFSDRTIVQAGELQYHLEHLRVEVIDNLGALRPSLLYAVSPSQINYLLDADTAPGPAIVTVLRENKPIAGGVLQVARVAPSLFSANGDGAGVPAGQVARRIGSSIVYEQLAEKNASGHWEPVAVNLGPSSDQVYLVLYGTGMRGRSKLKNVVLMVGGEVVPVIFLGDQNQFLGLDQLNAGPLPGSLAGKGDVEVALTVDGKPANRLTIRMR